MVTWKIMIFLKMKFEVKNLPDRADLSPQSFAQVFTCELKEVKTSLIKCLLIQVLSCSQHNIELEFIKF